MAIAADTGAGVSSFAKFVEIGDTLIGAFASDPNACRRQARDFDSGEPAVKPDGKPRLEEVMWFVACPGTTARTGTADDGYEPIEEGQVCQFSVSGYKWGQVIEARNQLPAANGFRKGQPCSGDIYTITLIGFSSETKNPAAASAAGFKVVDGRIIMRTAEEKRAWVLHQVEKGGNTNAAKDYEVIIRRPETADKAWEQAADKVFLEKPWVRTPVLVGAGTGPSSADDMSDAF